MTGSIRAYARHRGCTMQAVRKAIAAKRIAVGADGKIDFEKADQDWQRNTFAGASLGHQQKAAPVAAPARPAGPDPVAQYLAARAAKETYLAKKAQLEYEQQSGKLMETQRANEYASSFSQLIKDHLLAMPDRLAPLLAAIDDVDAARKVLIGDVGTVLKKLNKAISDAGL